jgi:phosphatidylglycerophosphate synthase
VVAHGAAVDGVIAGLARGDTDDAIVAAAPAVTWVEHGAVARHAIGTAAERAAAHRLLYRILIKPQDNAITRYLYRPVSFPLTRLLVHTPITPNQVSALVGVLVMIGCWLTASARSDRAILGTAVILVGSYVDCCDGEIARVKLLSSRFGAWMDTIVDELSTIGYMVALGIHCHLRFGPHYLGDLGVDPWLALTAGSLVTYFASMYVVYFNIIVAVGSANSQDYVARFVVAPGDAGGTVRIVPAPLIAATSTLPPWVVTAGVWISYIPRRDFLTWLTLVMAIVHLTHVMFGLLVLGGLITFTVLARDHAHLLGLRRSARAAGQVLQPPR